MRYLKRGFFARFGTLLVAIVAFCSGILVHMQWEGSKYDKSLWGIFDRPEIVEKEVKVEVFKPVIMTQDSEIALLNQTYRDALLKVTQAHDDFSNTSDAEKEIRQFVLIAQDALNAKVDGSK